MVISTILIILALENIKNYINVLLSKITLRTSLDINTTDDQSTKFSVRDTEVKKKNRETFNAMEYTSFYLCISRKIM